MALKDILPSKLGFGAAPLGNMFRDIPEEEALATVNCARLGWLIPPRRFPSKGDHIHH